MSLDIRSESRFQKKPAAVICDLDDTLYAYEPAHRAALTATKGKACRLLSIDEPEFDNFFKLARQEVKGRLGGTGAAHSRLLYFHRLIELAGMKSQPLLSLDLEQTYWRTFLSAARLFPDVPEFLDDLRSLSIPIGLVTDLTTQIQFRKLIYFGLDHAFDYIVTSEEAGADKPNARPFELVSLKTGLSAAPVWMIGDSPSGDIEGAAQHLDAITLQKHHEGVEITAQADAVFDHFSELRTLLRRNFSDGIPGGSTKIPPPQCYPKRK